MPVAVLIVNFRVYDEVDRALASLEPSLAPDDEVVIVDQVSDARKLSEIGRRYPRARLLPSAVNVGFAAAVNRAARESRAPYLMLLNPDTIVGDRVVRVLEDWLVAHADTAVVGPRILNQDGTLQPSARRFPGPSTAIAGRSTWLTRHFPNNWLSERNLPGRRADAPMDAEWLAGSCLMTRRDVFDRIGGLDEAFFLYWEDADYCRRVAQLGFRSTYLPTVSVHHLAGRSMALDPAPSIRAFHRSAYRLYMKHGGLAARLLAPFAAAGLWLRGEIRARQAVRQRP